MTPTFLVPAAVAVIGFIVWLVRLEGKNSSQAATIERIEKAHKAEMEKLETTHKLEMERLDKEIEKLQLEIRAHQSNQDVHFNARITEQADRLTDHRLKTMEKGIDDIQRKLNIMAGRE